MRRASFAFVAMLALVTGTAYARAAPSTPRSTRVALRSAAAANVRTSDWCVPVIRDDAIKEASVEIAPGDGIDAKLVSWPELRDTVGRGGPINSPFWTETTK